MSRNILTKDEYSSLFCTGDFIKSECYIDYITERLAEEFCLKYNEKKKCWYSEWNNNQRFVVELKSTKGINKILRWGYNYDYIPTLNNQNKLVWHRTDNSIKIHVEDGYYYHRETPREQEIDGLCP